MRGLSQCNKILWHCLNAFDSDSNYSIFEQKKEASPYLDKNKAFYYSTKKSSFFFLVFEYIQLPNNKIWQNLAKS